MFWETSHILAEPRGTQPMSSRIYPIGTLLYPSCGFCGAPLDPSRLHHVTDSAESDCKGWYYGRADVADE